MLRTPSAIIVTIPTSVEAFSAKDDRCCSAMALGWSSCFSKESREDISRQGRAQNVGRDLPGGVFREAGSESHTKTQKLQSGQAVGEGPTAREAHSSWPSTGVHLTTN